MEMKIYMDVCSIIVLFVILIAFYGKNSMPMKQNKIFVVLVWFTICSTFADLLGEMWLLKVEIVTRYLDGFVLEIINYIYFAARNIIPLLYLHYVRSVLNIQEKNKFRSRIYLYAPIAVSAALLAVTPFTNAVFYVDEFGRYTRGSMLPVLYVISLYYLCFTIGVVLKYRKNISASRVAAFCLFVIISIATSGIQVLFPHVAAESYGIAICLLLIYFTIQRPEEVLEGTTGLLNRNAFSKMLSMKLTDRKGFSICVVIVDELSFWNDSLGIEAVNKLLKAIADYLNKNFAGSQAYKISGRHFCLILDRDSEDTGSEMIAKIQDRFEKGWFAGAFNIKPTAHYSIIECPKHAHTLEEIIGLIDMATTKAELVMDSVVEVDEQDIKLKHRYQKIDRIVKEAVEENLLEVVYQPIYSVKEKKFISAEALVRLKSSELGNIPPDEFIPIAEKNGAIIKIDSFVQDTVCRFIKESGIRSLGIKYIEINMSIVECFQQNLVEDILGILEKYALGTECINLEITETAISLLPEKMEYNLGKLSESGINISLDDYGSGYSNIERILDFPYDIIKLDKTIVQSAFETKEADIVLTGTFGILKKLHKQVLAEGVETKEQAERLTEMGCDFLQGYYYARPMPAADFIEFAKKNFQEEGQ